MHPIETFADVIHEIVDTVLTGDAAAKAHAVIDGASGTRTPAPEPDPAEAAPAEDEAAAADTASDSASGEDEAAPATGGTDVPGS